MVKRTCIPEDTSWNLYLDHYPCCCGIQVITEFPANNSGKITDKLKVAIQNEIQEKIKQAAKNSRGMVQVVLNKWQNKELGKTLRQLGFKRYQGFYNPNTSHHCYLYIKIIANPPKRRTKKVINRRF